MAVCPACDGRGWCPECEGTRYTSSLPRPVECPCGSGLCPACGGPGLEASEPDGERWPWRPHARSGPAIRRSHPIPAWVEEVVAAPEDMYVRLVGADIVEREDPERARFMREQIEAEPHLAGAMTALEVERTIVQTTCRRVASYSPELARLASERVIAARSFARGMVEHVTMAAADFLAHADEVFERAPIRFLTLTHLEDRAAAVAASPWLARLRAMRLPREEARPTRAHGHRGFDKLVVNRIDDLTLSALCESPHLATLEALDIDGHDEISVVTWGRLALAAPNLRWVVGAPRRGDVMIEESGYELTRWIEPDPIAIAIDTAAGSQVAWLPLDEPYLAIWDRLRAVCAGAPVMRRRTGAARDA